MQDIPIYPDSVNVKDNEKLMFVALRVLTVTRFRSGKLSLDNVSERRDEMRLGMTLTSNPSDSSFVVSHVTPNAQ